MSNDANDRHATEHMRKLFRQTIVTPAPPEMVARIQKLLAEGPPSRSSLRRRAWAWGSVILTIAAGVVAVAVWPKSPHATDNLPPADLPAAGPDPRPHTDPHQPGQSGMGFDLAAVRLDVTSQYGELLGVKNVFLSGDDLTARVPSFPAGDFAHGWVIQFGPDGELARRWTLTREAGRFRADAISVRTGLHPGFVLMAVVVSRKEFPTKDVVFDPALLIDLSRAYDQPATNHNPAETDRLKINLLRSLGFDPADAAIAAWPYEQVSRVRRGK